MSYVPGFEHDIVISYSHLDNLTESPGQQGWVSRFHSKLHPLLLHRVGMFDKLKVWWDKNLTGNSVFNREIEDRVRSAALLLCLTSTGYIKSEYCTKERRWFSEQAANDRFGLHVGYQSRIINCLLDNIQFASWPEEMRGTNCHEFNTGEAGQLGWPIDPSTAQFEEKMKKLVDEIMATLDAMATQENEQRAQASGGNQKDAQTFRIFVGDVSDTLRDTRKRLVTELEHCGLNVMRLIPPPYDSPSHEKGVSEAVKQAQLAVNLLDGFPGREIDDDPGHTYAQKQATIALGCVPHQLVWVPDDLEISKVSDEVHRNLLTTLETRERKGDTYNFLRSSTASVAREILMEVDELKRARELESDSLPAGVLLDVHRNDQKFADQFADYLAQKHIDTFINPDGDSPLTNLSQMKGQLGRVQSLVVFFGNVSRDWVRARLIEGFRLALEIGNPLKSLIVCLAPPRKVEEELAFNLGALKIKVMDNSEGIIHPDLMDQIIFAST
jgi:hypothetical protein